VTLALTFLFVLAFRIEQNVASVFGLSTFELVTLDAFPVGTIVQLFAPLLHATAAHLVSTLVWFVPFGYFLERRRPWDDYLAFVFLAGILSTTFGPAVFVVLGASPGLAVGGSGITYALVAREATARSMSVVDGRPLTRTQWIILAIAIVGLLLSLLTMVSSPPARTSVVGHAIGLVVGVGVGLSERYVSISPE
jgi:membrane associated rhomboid family serine protease